MSNRTTRAIFLGLFFAYGGAMPRAEAGFRCLCTSKKTGEDVTVYTVQQDTRWNVFGCQNHGSEGHPNATLPCHLDDGSGEESTGASAPVTD